MTRQKRFIVVFTSKDGKVFSRAVVWDDDFLNSALIGKPSKPPTVINAGASSMRATALVHEINNLKNGYTATVREYDGFHSIPETIGITGPQIPPVTSGSFGDFAYVISGSMISIYTD